MELVEENVLPDTREQEGMRVQDFSVELELDNTGFVVYDTPNIMGCLDWVFVQTLVPVRVSVESLSVPGLFFLEEVNLSKDTLLPVRFQPVDNKGNNLTFGVEKHVLNESVRITVQGTAGSRVGCWVRWY